ncbi:MAG: hypothetical protein QNL82_06165 [Candidatus Thioglobus sp.]
MKNLNLTKITGLITLFLISATFSLNASASCDKTGDAITTALGNSVSPVKDGGIANDQCSDTPDFYKLKFYKIGLCAADPSNNDFSSCQYMLDDATGVDHVISYPSTGEMDIPQFSIAPGTYPYMVGVVSNKLGIKHSITTTNDVSGKTGEGRYCWTTSTDPSSFDNDQFTSTAHGVTTVESGARLIECGISAGSAAYAYEIINVLRQETCKDADGGDAAAYTAFTNGGKSNLIDENNNAINVGNGTASMSLLNSSEAFATDCRDAAKILWTTTLTTPAVVTTDSTYELKMRSQDAVSVDFSGQNDNDIMKMGADPIQLYLTVN